MGAGGSCKQGGSSGAWLRRHVGDPYVRAAASEGLPSRAAFKLLGIQEKHRILRPGHRVLDLGASPGGWSIVAADVVMGKKAAAGGGRGGGPRAGGRGRVVSVDLLPMEAIDADGRAITLRGDFREGHVCRLISAALGPMPADAAMGALEPAGGGNEHSLPSADRLLSSADQSLSSADQPLPSAEVDVVLSDVAASFTGDHATDQARTASLVRDALTLCRGLSSSAQDHRDNRDCDSHGGGGRRHPEHGYVRLAPGGTFLGKFFMGGEAEELRAEARGLFRRVRLVKPKSSRSESSEMYLLAMGFTARGEARP